jgi:hypothetical protein
LRRAPRYPTDLTCFIELPDGSLLPGALRDISVGGVGLEVMRLPDLESEALRVVFEHEGVQLRLPCSIRHVRSLWEKDIVHAAFSGLALEEQRAVERFIHELVEPERPDSRKTRWHRFVQRLAGRPHD